MALSDWGLWFGSRGPGRPQGRPDQRAALRPLMAAIAKRNANVVCLGDSITEGFGLSPITDRWQDRLAAALKTRYSIATTGGTYVPALTFTGASATRLDNFTLGGPAGSSVTVFGLGARTLWLNAVGQTATLNFTGTGIDLFWAKSTGGGNWTYAVDGGAAVPIASNAATSQGGQRTQIRGLSAGAHSIVITVTTASAFIEGARVFNGDESVGIRFWDAGHSGYRVADYVATATTTDNTWTTVSPDAIVVNLGTNDYRTPILANRRTAAQFKADMLSYMGRITTAMGSKQFVFVVVIPEQPLASGGATMSTWAEYRAAYADIVTATSNAVLVDLDTALGSYWATSTDPFTLSQGDYVHPNKDGHQLISDFLLDSLIAT